MKNIISILVSILGVVLIIGCAENDLGPEWNRNTMGGDIDLKSKIPSCGDGYQKRWAASNTYNDPQIINGKLYVHAKGLGVQQQVCKKDNGHIIIFMVQKKIDELQPVK